MTKENLKELVKQHFNLTEVKETTNEKFATATLEDGTKISNDKGSAFAEGDKVFVEVDGELKPAPAGDHITESGIVVTLDAESIIVGMKKPDEEGEGSEDLAEDKVEEEMSTEVVLAEEVKEEELEEDVEMKLEDVVELIAEVVEEKVSAIKDKMEKIEEEMGAIKEKMNAFSNSPAEVSTTKSNFSTAKSSKVSKGEARYNAMLAKLK